MDRAPTTLLEAVRYFADPQVAHDFFVRLRWPEVVACPRSCGSVNVFYMANRRLWQCRDCKKQFTAKVGTIFEDSPIGFDKWMPAVWLIANAKNGVSSHEVGRALGVTQKTAWFMLHRIRLAMGDDDGTLLSGEVEADETYIGGRIRRKNIGSSNSGTKSKGPKHKRGIVHGIMERGGKMKAFVVPDDTGASLVANVFNHVDPNADIFTDSHRGYWDLQYTHNHYFVNHAVAYVQGNVHTNHVENFWNLLKRMLNGTYVKVSPWHLMAYVQEEVRRFNDRDLTDGERFPRVAKNAEGKRVTYKALTAKSPTWRLKPGRAKRSLAYRASRED
jgi:transposase-like protein